MRTVELVISDERLSMVEPSLVQCIEVLEQCPEICLPDGALEVAFVDETTCSQLHESFFDDPEVTDVMTFPGSPEDDHAGDIAICPAVAMEASQHSGMSFHEELSLYLVHACLHLTGLDDREEDDVKEMRAAEESVMRQLRKAKALLNAEWSG
ncbi:rRNA maturation RNase YbeY [Puniceicoccales bacterium CK1056]|uniref:Endoribonuclease YbeY n=1 Tax=Oceanipulchritudo coccoides TaxID=2706888 RepID=A0A6B2M4H7_9BACT|nr:rRNA maturation RNase YbeY [Oceanipulchritudo coccoides]NDV63256.1 rRNA maturation RNase YbeY [Oceanipulchritudo coccoides]